MGIKDKILRYLGSTSSNVGRVFIEPYIDKPIKVTSYINEELWYYKEYDLIKKEVKGDDIKAERPLQFYINHNLEEG